MSQRGHSAKSFNANPPAEIDSICTVLPRSVPGSGTTLGWYSFVSKRVLMSVDFPKPDSPDISFGAGLKGTVRTDNHCDELEPPPVS